MKISKATAIFAWIGFNLLALIGMPLLTLLILDGEMKAARQVNPQVSTDGDSLGLPVFGVAILTFTVLLVTNLIIGFVLWLYKRRAKSSDKVQSPIAAP